MTKDELITKQQLEIESLREEQEAFEYACTKILNTMYSIGGPLNDNRDGFTNKQLQWFAKIEGILSGMG